MAQPACPVLQGLYLCGPKGGEKNLRLSIRTEGNVYTIRTGSEEPYQVIADGTARTGVFGSAEKKAEYRAACEGGRMNMIFQMSAVVHGEPKVLAAKDSFYAERGGLVRVRVYDARSDIKGAPAVISCSPIIENVL